MNYATNFAIVKNGTVTNLLRGLVYNTMDDFPNAVHTENLDVQIGDTYENGVLTNSELEEIIKAGVSRCECGYTAGFPTTTM